MGTNYSIFVKSNEVEGSTDLFYFLETLGASNLRPHPPTSSPDSFFFDYADLYDSSIYNERLAPSGEEDWPEWGYDFQIVEFVPFRHDDQAVRDVMFELARQVARRFPILLMYADSVLAKSESPGELDISDPDHPFLLDAIKASGESEAMRKEGFTFNRMGIE